jgi:hypothetical protein
VREVLDEEVGTLLFERGAVVGCAGSEDAAAGSLAGADTGGCVLDDEGFEGGGVAALGAEEVRVREGLATGDRVGGDEDFGGSEAGNGDGFSSVEEGG